MPANVLGVKRHPQAVERHVIICLPTALASGKLAGVRFNDGLSGAPQTACFRYVDYSRTRG